MSLPIRIALTVGNQSVLGGVEVSPVVPSNGGELPVNGNATALVVEARWTCGTPTCRLRMQIQSHEADVLNAFGDGYIFAQVPEGTPIAGGDWDVAMRADSVSQDVEGEIRATFFYGVPVPNGYTAFEAS